VCRELLRQVPEADGTEEVRRETGQADEHGESDDFVREGDEHERRDAEHGDGVMGRVEPG